MSVATAASRRTFDSAEMRWVATATAAAGIAGIAIAVTGSVLVPAALAAATAVLVFCTARWGFQGFVAVLILSALLPVPTVSLGEAAFPIATVAAPALLAAGWAVSRRRGVHTRVPHVAPYALLLGIAALSLFASWFFWNAQVPTGSARGYGHRSIDYQLVGVYLLAVPLMAYAAGVLCMRLIRFQHVLVWLAAGLLGFTLQGLILWVLHPSNPVVAFTLQQRDTVEYQWAVLLFVIALVVALQVTSRRLRLLAALLVFIALATAAVQYVLSAWLAIGAATLVIVFVRFRAKGMVIVIGCLLMGAAMAEPLVATIITQRLASSDVDRLKIWQSAIVVWSKSPLIGVGPGNLASYMETFSLFPLGLVLQGYQQAHDIFLEILAEEGVIGLALLGIFVGLVVRSLVTRPAPLGVERRIAGTIGLGVLVAAAVIAAFGGGFIPTIASAGYNELPKTVDEWFLIGAGVAAAMRAGSLSLPAERA